jgi:hypothetical protein
VLLKPSLSNGFVVGVAVDQPAALAGQVILSATSARRYGLGRKALVIASDDVADGGSDSSLEFKPSRRVARKLRRAKALVLTLTVTATRADGVKTTKTSHLHFR